MYNKYDESRLRDECRFCHEQSCSDFVVGTVPGGFGFLVRALGFVGMRFWLLGRALGFLVGVPGPSERFSVAGVAEGRRRW